MPKARAMAMAAVMMTRFMPGSVPIMPEGEMRISRRKPKISGSTSMENILWGMAEEK